MTKRPMTKWGGSPWLKELTPIQRERVHTILDEHAVTYGNTSQKARRGQHYWIKQSPTTGRAPTDVLLLLKAHDGKVLREWRIWPREGDPHDPRPGAYDRGFTRDDLEKRSSGTVGAARSVDTKEPTLHVDH